MKARLLQVSREMFLRHGYSKIRIDEIAAELNISKKTIYNHFGSKEELLFEVIEESKREIENDFAAIESNTDLQYEEKVKACLSLLGTWVSRVQLLIHDLKRNLPQAYSVIVAFNKEILVKQGVTILEQGVRLGKLNEGWTLNMALFIFMSASEKLFADSFHGAMPAEMVTGFPISLEERLHSVVDIIYNGISH